MSRTTATAARPPLASAPGPACCRHPPRRATGPFPSPPGLAAQASPHSRSTRGAHASSEIVAFVFLDLAVIIVLARLMGRLAVQGRAAGGDRRDHRRHPARPEPARRAARRPRHPAVPRRRPARTSTCWPSSGWCCSCSWSASRWTCRSSGAGRRSRSRCRSPRSCCRSRWASCWPACCTTATTSSTASRSASWPFALFIGAAMSITAFPVLARILTERGMHRIPTGVLALACAAVDDVLAWALLAVVVAVVAATSLAGVSADPGASRRSFALVMFGVVRPAAASGWSTATSGSGGSRPDMLALVLVGLLRRACVDRGDRHPLHLRRVRLRRRHAAAGRRRADATRSSTGSSRSACCSCCRCSSSSPGSNVDIGAHRPGRALVELALILLVAIVGKFVGAFVAARVAAAYRTGRRPRSAC